MSRAAVNGLVTKDGFRKQQVVCPPTGLAQGRWVLDGWGNFEKLFEITKVGCAQYPHGIGPYQLTIYGSKMDQTDRTFSGAT